MGDRLEPRTTKMDGRTTMSARHRVGLACGLLAGLVVGGCVSPGRIDTNLLGRYQEWARDSSPAPRKGEEGLNVIEQATTRPAVPVPIVRDPEQLTSRIERKLSEVDMTLAKALELARANGLPIDPAGMDAKLPVVRLSLQDAVRLALVNNLDIRVVSFDPAIARTDMVAAASKFDVTVFGNVSDNLIDRRTSTQLDGSNVRQNPLEVGLKKRTVLGTDVQLKYNLGRTRDNSPFIDISPYYESVLSLELTQPLLRFGGMDYNLGELRIARVNHDISLEAFREQVDKTVTEVTSNYWSLVQARRDADIQQRLLIITIQTFDRVRKRRQIDATQVAVKQAESAVLARWASLVRARKQIFDVQDLLSRLLADPRMPVSSHKYEIAPTDDPVDEPVTVDPTEQIEVALQRNPTLRQAYLAIRAADVAVRIARNETLPVLNAVASAGIQGLRGDGFPAVTDMTTMDFFSHNAGLVFEYPLGNRGPKAEYARRRFEKLKAATTYHNAADQVAVAVNEAVRQIETTYVEYRTQQRAKEAVRVELKALDDTEKIRGVLTPEFLQLKLSTQEQLAAAARLELDALISYNNALAQLDRLTGVLLDRQNVVTAAEEAIAGLPPKTTKVTPVAKVPEK